MGNQIETKRIFFIASILTSLANGDLKFKNQSLFSKIG
jgi:hypothetical protein